MSEEGRKNISKARTGLEISEEGRQKLSYARKRDYQNGVRDVPSFANLKHTEETLKKMSESAKNRKRGICPYCGIECSVNTLTRWHGDNCKMNFEDNEK
jgi:predicted molibdopterin-dependent oxidoreductase YjgC